MPGTTSCFRTPAPAPRFPQPKTTTKSTAQTMWRRLVMPVILGSNPPAPRDGHIQTNKHLFLCLPLYLSVSLSLSLLPLQLPFTYRYFYMSMPKVVTDRHTHTPTPVHAHLRFAEITDSMALWSILIVIDRLASTPN